MLEKINAVAWAITTTMIIFYGIYFTIKLKFPQFRMDKIIKSLMRKEKGITPITTLFLTLAGRIGVGSIAGVALAIYLGGPGTIFWMWLVAIISGSLAYTETLLAIKYKEKEGGPAYYIKNGYKSKRLAFIYSVIVVVTYLIGFIPIQANTISKTADIMFTISNPLVGMIISFFSLIAIYGGIKKITKITSKIVPLMTILYIFLALSAVIINIREMPTIIKLIVTSAFDFTPFFSGFIVVMLIGIQRGIFSNESGIGLGAIAASTANTTNGAVSGYIQVLGVYITTIIICTATAFLILTTNYDFFIDNPNGIELTNYAFNYHFGNLGNILLFICILLFSFSTILTGYYYCESSLTFMLKKIKKLPLKIITCLSVFVGSILSAPLIWNVIDIFVAFIALINMHVLYNLRKEIMIYHKKCDKI